MTDSGQIGRRVEPSPPGTVIVYQGQRYRIEGYQPHTRRDGAATELMRVSSTCAECGAPFESVTSVAARWFSRRCPEHRKPGVRVR